MSSQQSVSAATGRAPLNRLLARVAVRGAAAFMILNGAAGQATAEPSGSAAAATARVRPEIYAPVTLQTDVSSLSAQERQMIGLFIEAAKVMDGLFWQQAYGDRDTLLTSLKDPATRQFAEFNYGPWDRLDRDLPFVAGVGPKPEGARFYPPDMTKEEFEAARLEGKDSLYTVIERDERGALKVVPYHERGPASSVRLRISSSKRAGSRPIRVSSTTSSCARRRCAPTTTSRAISPGST